MSIVSKTGKTRDGKCTICGTVVLTEEWRSINGTHWSPVAHRAPCGAHCMGGGVDSNEMDVHIKHFGPCPRCGMTGTEVAEIITNDADTERLVFHRYTPDYRPELGFRFDYEKKIDGAWTVDARFGGDADSLDATKDTATMYYPWLKEMRKPDG